MKEALIVRTLRQDFLKFISRMEVKAFTLVLILLLAILNYVVTKETPTRNLLLSFSTSLLGAYVFYLVFEIYPSAVNKANSILEIRSRILKWRDTMRSFFKLYKEEALAYGVPELEKRKSFNKLVCDIPYNHALVTPGVRLIIGTTGPIVNNQVEYQYADLARSINSKFKIFKNQGVSIERLLHTLHIQKHDYELYEMIFGLINQDDTMFRTGQSNITQKPQAFAAGDLDMACLKLDRVLKHFNEKWGMESDLTLEGWA